MWDGATMNGNVECWILLDRRIKKAAAIASLRGFLHFGQFGHSHALMKSIVCWCAANVICCNSSRFEDMPAKAPKIGTTHRFRPTSKSQHRARSSLNKSNIWIYFCFPSPCWRAMQCVRHALSLPRILGVQASNSGFSRLRGALSHNVASTLARGTAFSPSLTQTFPRRYLSLASQPARPLQISSQMPPKNAGSLRLFSTRTPPTSCAFSFLVLTVF